jgi:hypothetical protein
MKNEQKFKQRIAEIAAKIAEGAYGEEDEVKKPKQEEDMEEAEQKSDGEKVTTILSRISSLRTPMNLVDQASEFTDLLRGLLPMMPKLTPQRAIQGMNTLRNELAKTAANANSNEPKSGSEGGDEDLPQLQEAFNRINRK